MGNLTGKIGSNLTKPGVQDPTGDTTYYDNPAAAGIAMAHEAARANGGPSTSDVQGTIGDPTIAPTPLLNAGDVVPGPDNLTVRSVQPVASPQPKMITPSFADASADGPFSPRLTTKGKALSLLLNAEVGAMAGKAASEQGDPRHGYPGWGTAALAGFRMPIDLQRERVQDQQRQDQIDAETQNAESRASQADAANTRASRVMTKQGLAEQGPDGKWTIVPGTEPDAPQSEADKEGERIQARLAQAKLAGLDPEQTNKYVFGIQPATETAYRDWRADNPDAPVSEYYAAKRKPSDGNRRATPGQFAQMDVRHAAALRQAEAAFARVPEPATFDWNKADDATKAKYTAQRAAKDAAYRTLENAKAQAEQAYGDQIVAGGGLRLKGASTPAPGLRLKGAGGPKELTQGVVDGFMKQAGNDPAKAKALAAAAGYRW